VVALISAAAGLVVGLSGSALLQGVRAEVYALNLALCVAALWAAAKFILTRSGSQVIGAGLFCGLAMSNHHLVSAAVALPVATVITCLGLRGERGRSRAVLMWGLGAALGLAMWSYLPLRAHTDPLVNWGDPDTAARFIWTVSAKLFSPTAERSLAGETSGPLVAMAARAVMDLGWGVALVGLLGLYLSFRSRRTLPMAALLAASAALTMTAAMLGGFNPANPDSRGYYLVFLVCWTAWAALAAGLGIGWVGAKAGWTRSGGSCAAAEWKKAAVTAMAACLLLLPAAWSARAIRTADRSEAWGAFEASNVVLTILAPRALFLAGYHETVFGVWCRMESDGARPDVAMIYRQNVGLPGRKSQLSARWPSLSSLIGALATRKGVVEAIRAELSNRPIYVEPASATADPIGGRIRASLAPRSVLFEIPSAFSKKRPRPYPTGHGSTGWDAGIFHSRLQPLSNERGTRRYMVWKYFQTASVFVDQGRCGLASEPLLRAWQLAPEDPQLRSLAGRCGMDLPDAE
jgi:hypothetical protein